jgi:hypothetical protein
MWAVLLLLLLFRLVLVWFETLSVVPQPTTRHPDDATIAGATLLWRADLSLRRSGARAAESAAMARISHRYVSEAGAAVTNVSSATPLSSAQAKAPSGSEGAWVATRAAEAPAA